MSDLSVTEYGTNVQTYPLVTDYNSYMKEFAQYDVRIPTNILKRFYMNFYLAAATTTGSPYVIGICPIKAYLVGVKHVCKTVTSAATVEIEIGTETACMTAQAAANTVSTATLATATTDRLCPADGIITCKIATASGELVDLAIELIFEPYR